ncbi:MAG: 1-deoxy-D-xylulose-5-phosphate reductoisomerase [Dehalococcoidia bacterium]|nr:1-deoxy-D-xylulose-5-phosphate reductoisomerase [Dehalococcoidia bacterium]
MKSLVILGSTGSIGRQTLDVVRAFPDEFKITGLAAGGNTTLLARQVQEFHPEFISIGEPNDKTFTAAISGRLSGKKPELVCMEEMVAQTGVDAVVVATTGVAGILPTLTAIDAGKEIVLANKEVLVMAGRIVMEKARVKGVPILPMDSEHSAVWQCLWGENASGDTASNVSRLILTASGGPFHGYSKEELAGVTREDALHHPTWKMGKKITIDSATLFNKGIEIIEAHWLFGIPYSDIDVIIHPESIIHSMVEFRDGSIKAQLGSPDMRIPIQLALTYPRRLPNPGLPHLDFNTVKSLSFKNPDVDKFPCLRLAREAGLRGGTFPAAVSAADEIAVDLFLAGKIGFTDIPALLEKVLDSHKGIAVPGLDDIMEADAWARRQTFNLAAVSAC